MKGGSKEAKKTAIHTSLHTSEIVEKEISKEMSKNAFKIKRRLDNNLKIVEIKIFKNVMKDNDGFICDFYKF